MKAHAPLRELQEHWYQVLKDTGFQDIEKFQGHFMQLIEPASKRFKNITDIERTSREEYFRFMFQMCHKEDTEFRSDEDLYIMFRHSDGAQIKEILEELEELGVKRDRKTIRIIIRRYEMAWKLRFYTRRKLHLK
jgi:hypothetical protein